MTDEERKALEAFLERSKNMSLEGTGMTEDDLKELDEVLMLIAIDGRHTPSKNAPLVLPIIRRLREADGKRIAELEAENDHLQTMLNKIAWLAQRPYDPNEQLTGGSCDASDGQAGLEA